MRPKQQNRSVEIAIKLRGLKLSNVRLRLRVRLRATAPAPAARRFGTNRIFGARPPFDRNV